jgi:drug/metabolite transporter (DMT)-like permease
VGSARTAIYVNLQPVLAVLIGWLWLGEGLGWTQVVGAAVIVAGVLLTRMGTSQASVHVVAPAERPGAQRKGVSKPSGP